MLPRRTPQEAYRRVDFDARIAGANPQQLALLCHEQLSTALGSAVHAERMGDNARKSANLARALSALAALDLGLDHSLPIAAALSTLHAAARRTVLDSVLAFDSAALKRLQADFHEISGAFQGAQGHG